MKENEWTKLSSEAFETKEKAQRFVDIMTNQHYGAHKDTEKTTKPLEFKITSSRGKFYIEYKILEKHTL